MEDPWVNAWGDPQKSEQPSNSPQTSTWISSSKFVTDDQADIAVPSWETDSGAIWDDTPDLHKDLWNRNNRASQLWAAPTLDSIGFAKPSPETQPETSSPISSPQEYSADSSEASERQDTFSTPEANTRTVFQSSTPDSEEEQSSTYASPVQVSREVEEENLPRQTSPDRDGFGTFETAVDEYPQSDPWVPSLEHTEDWGATWKGNDEVSEADDEPVDEWERAKQMKEIQDRYVPPELLDSILRQFNEFSGIHWPNENSDATPDPYRPTTGELAGILGINSITDRLIPSDLTLPVPPTFTKTFISKEMAEALKLTRHHIVSRNGPLAIYMLSKGSLSWEAAIKSKPDVTEVDVVPSGWRIVTKDNIDQLASANDSKQKSSGGLLSFFGRKTTTTSQVAGSSSPVRSTTPGAASPRSSTASPRPSLETNAANSTAAKPGSSSKALDSSPSDTLSAIAEISDTSKTELNTRPPEPAPEILHPPSAVSRFLERFSRSAKSPGADKRNSIALSSDDLEFLSDIVPSASDEMGQNDTLDSLSDMIRAPPVPTKTPPPLAPPPRAPISSKPHLPPISSTSTGEGQLFGPDSGFPSLLPPPQPKHLPQRTPASFSISPLQPTTHSTLPSPPSPIQPATTSSRLSVAPKPPASVPPLSSSVFDDDEFSDFQTSPSATSSAALVPMDSVLVSLTAPRPTQQEMVSFDDFDDFISPGPPRVPEKSTSISSQITPVSTPPILPPPSGPPFRPSTPAKSSPQINQSTDAHRASRRADSHQRTLTLLETAATRGTWPAPPSPLPNAIPPPSASSGPDLFNAFEEQSQTALAAVVPSHSALASDGDRPTTIPVSSPAVLAPPRWSLTNEKTAITLNATFPSGMGANAQVPGISPTISPPPQIQPIPSYRQPLSQPQPRPDSQSWDVSSLQQPQSTRQPAVTSPFSLFTPAPLVPQPSGSSNNNSGSGGKLSAQDLSFFENL